MATIATLSATVVADVNPFVKSIEKARKELRKFVDDIPLANTNVSAFAAGMVAAGAAGLTYYTVKAMESVDAIAKLSDRLAISTQDLIGWQHAAELAGVGASEFEVALDKLNKSGDKRSLPQIAEDIASISDPAERANAAIELFGKNGARMVNVLLGGASSLQAAKQEMELFGKSVSRVDAAKIEAANDSFTRLKALAEGVGTQVAVQLSPFLEAAANHIVKMGTEGGTMGQKIGEAFKLVLQAAGTLADYFELLKAGWHGFVATITYGVAIVVKQYALLGQAIDFVLEKVGIGSTGTGDFLNNMSASAFEEAGQSVDEMAEAMDRFNSGVNASKAKELFDGIAKGAEEAGKKVADEARNRLAGQGMNEDTGEFALDTIMLDSNAIKSRKDELIDANKEIAEAAKKEAKKLQDQQDEWNDIMEKGALHWDDLSEKYTNPETVQKDIGFAQTFNSRLIDVNSYAKAGQKEQVVKDPQLETTNKMLYSIDRKMSESKSAVVS